jgi:hypothetical protein
VAAYDAANNTSTASTAASATTLAATVGTSLADLAARLKAGEWAKLDTNGFNSGDILRTSEAGSIAEYNNELNWDPIHRKAYIVGTARGSSGTYGTKNQKWVQFTDSNNSWSELPNLPFYLGFHAYDHAALDTTTGDFYVRVVESADVWRFDAQSQNWSQLPDLPNGAKPCCESLDYFPELGGVVYVEGNHESGSSRILVYKRSTNQWSSVSASSVTMGDYHSFSEYDGAHKVLYFGGGEVFQSGSRTDFYKLDSAGKVTKLANLPISAGTDSALTVVDPVTGNFLLFSERNPSQFYEFNFDTNSWATRSIQSSFRATNSSDDLQSVAAAIPEHGVMMFVHDNDSVWLYKHASP